MLRYRNRINPLFTILTPVLLTLAYPNYNLSLVAWIALIPLFFALRKLNWTASFVISWIIGTLSFMGIFAWINHVEKFSAPYYLLGSLYLGIFFGVFGGLSHLFDRSKLTRPFFFAALWVCTEYCRSNLSFLALPWALIGHSQYKNINLIQFCSFTGVYGISFIVVLVNASLAELIIRISRSFQKKTGVWDFIYMGLCLLPVSIAIFLGLWGRNTLKSAGKEAQDVVKLGVVQGNIPQKIKWKRETLSMTIDRYENFTKVLAHENPCLVIWPETALPVDLKVYPSLKLRIKDLAKEIEIPIIFGSAGTAKIGAVKDKIKAVYNSAFYISDKGVPMGEYRKTRLLPFGEYVPSVGSFSTAFFFPELKSPFLPGEELKVFPLQDKLFGVTICWENIFPDLFRRFVLKGASFMVNISNDAWFKDSAGPYQHLMCNIFRAVENRISIARAANTGISCFIDPFGRIQGYVKDQTNGGLNVAGVLSKDVNVLKKRTFYTLYGDIFAFGCIAIISMYFFYRLFRALFRKYLARSCKMTKCTYCLKPPQHSMRTMGLEGEDFP